MLFRSVVHCAIGPRGPKRVLEGEGTLGWREHASFNAIVVMASGPLVPPALPEQLAIGGRVVMPVGRGRESQRLVRKTRSAEDDYEEEYLEEVAFVPLVGARRGPVQTHRRETIQL